MIEVGYAFPSGTMINGHPEKGYLNIELMDAAEKGFPRSFRRPRCASSAEIARRDLWPPFGRLRRS